MRGVTGWAGRVRSFTRGEQTQFCGDQRFTADCMNRRIGSTLGFLSQMSQTFPAIPGQWVSGTGTRAFPDPANAVSRDDAGARFKDTSAWVYADGQARGVVVSWNLGDGDLTSSEVSWALRTMLANKAEFGIPELPLHNIVGALWAPEGSYPQCAGYAHADHRAVHVALWGERFGARYTAASTCGADSDASRRQAASTAYWDAAFGAGGAFAASYGWLRPEGWPHDGSGSTQWAHFNRYQPMWVRS